MDEERDLIGQPLNSDEIRRLVELAGGIDKILSTKSPKYAQYREQAQSDADWIHLMAEEPRLIKRPLVEHREKLYVGFTPSAWQDLLS